MPDWLLIETFGPTGAEPTVIGQGTTPKGLVPLRTLLRGRRSLTEVQEALALVAHSGDVLDRQANGRRVVARPLRTYAGNLHGAWVWAGPVDESLPERPHAGAFQFNLTTDKIAGSDDLLDLYGVAPELRRTERTTAEAFGRLITNADESAALALIVRSQPGDEHRATWTVRRDDGQLRAAHFTLRAIAETNAAGAREVVLRGITHDLGPAESIPSAPPLTVLAQQVLAATAEPGTHRAIVNLRNLRLIRWVATDQPPAGIAWENQPGDEVDHWIHPEDLATARLMTQSAVEKGSATGHVRFRTTDRTWRAMPVAVRLMLLDATTTAALFTLRSGDVALA